MFSSIELTMLRKVDTKLPVNLWIDENSEHKSRLMFQNNTSDTLTKKSDLIPISVEDCLSILAKGNTLRISSVLSSSILSWTSQQKSKTVPILKDSARVLFWSIFIIVNIAFLSALRYL